jgi:hypothetical protein
MRRHAFLPLVVSWVRSSGFLMNFRNSLVRLRPDCPAETNLATRSAMPDAMVDAGHLKTPVGEVLGVIKRQI